MIHTTEIIKYVIIGLLSIGCLLFLRDYLLHRNLRYHPKRKFRIVEEDNHFFAETQNRVFGTWCYCFYYDSTIVDDYECGASYCIINDETLEGVQAKLDELLEKSNNPQLIKIYPYTPNLK